MNKLKKIYEGYISKNKESKIVIFTKSATEPNVILTHQYISNFNNHNDKKYSDGWNIAYGNPEDIVLGFSQLKIKDGFKLCAYQYIAGGNGNGVVWAIPRDKELLNPNECEFLDMPKPNFAIDPMKIIKGDKSPLSYLQASIAYHELKEFGAIWHGVSWGFHEIISPYDENKQFYNDEDIQCNTIECNTRVWEPHFYYNDNNEPTIIFYTSYNKGNHLFIKFKHTFSKVDYTVKVEERIIDEAVPSVVVEPGICI